MIDIEALRELARERLRDAMALFKAKRYDAADYFLGYAIEIALKARICRTLRWEEGFPESNSEFTHLQSFKTHDLNVLLRLSGQKDRIKEKHGWAWSLIEKWNPAHRYRLRGAAIPADVQSRLAAARVLVRVL